MSNLQHKLLEVEDRCANLEAELMNTKGENSQLHAEVQRLRAELEEAQQQIVDLQNNDGKKKSKRKDNNKLTPEKDGKKSPNKDLEGQEWTGVKDKEKEKPYCGIQIRELADFRGGVRLRVIAVNKDSPAARAGVQPNDYIVAVGGQAVPRKINFFSHLNKANVGDVVVLSIEAEDGQRRDVGIELEPLSVA
eukprot:NODE_8043_length_716_cov_34.406408_g7425_i0.p1 GENE.NODE_8043_length_716_cov_34.406408_g7425_i0~~NODE_8043_length_716_cov_34.406408_g7425_i0.p1  ORF type:complete len:192 (-),score=43.90 NODE_8043_length_716_cov_34.406408_g7425_i0:82-657(-)